MKTTLNIDIPDVIERLMENNPKAEHHRHYCKYNTARIVADAEFVAQHLDPSDKLLDVGAVPPLMAALLSEAGFKDLHIADPYPAGFESYFDKAGIGFHKVNLLTDDCADLRDSFDFVCLNEVIEHLSGNLLEAVANVAKCCKVGGKFLVTTPNLRSLSGIAALLRYHSGLASKPHDTVREQYERETSQYGYYGHLREFTANETIDFIQSFGFKHVATSMQANYLKRGNFFRYVSWAEKYFPKWRLFGKYLFEKLPEDAPIPPTSVQMRKGKRKRKKQQAS